MSAVSNSVTPRSIALWITLREVSRSVRWPKLLQPRPTAETRRPEPPRLRICMDQCSKFFEGAHDLSPNCLYFGESCARGEAREGITLWRGPIEAARWEPHGAYASRPNSDNGSRAGAGVARAGGAPRSAAAVMRRTDFSASRAIALRSALIS